MAQWRPRHCKTQSLLKPEKKEKHMFAKKLPTDNKLSHRETTATCCAKRKILAFGVQMSSNFTSLCDVSELLQVGRKQTYALMSLGVLVASM